MFTLNQRNLMNDSIIHSIAILGKIEKAYISIEQLFNYAQGFIQYAFLREPSSFFRKYSKELQRPSFSKRGIFFASFVRFSKHFSR